MTERHRSDLRQAVERIRIAIGYVPQCESQTIAERTEGWMAEAIGLIQGAIDATDGPSYREGLEAGIEAAGLAWSDDYQRRAVAHHHARRAREAIVGPADAVTRLDLVIEYLADRPTPPAVLPAGPTRLLPDLDRCKAGRGDFSECVPDEQPAGSLRVFDEEIARMFEGMPAGFEDEPEPADEPATIKAH